MPGTILVVGATGNTGKSAVRNLSLRLQGRSVRIIALSRSKTGAAAQTLAQLDGVEVEEKDWTEIDSAWLTARSVAKVYIAPHNGPSQFADESGFYLALLQARVNWVVRVSTNHEYMSPVHPVYYGRAHWAIENLLSQPEFAALQWTSLQPNFFTASYLASAAEWIQKFRKEGTQAPLCVVPAADAHVAMLDPEDVGAVGAFILALDDPSPHASQRYVLSGPEDVSGNDIVKLVEKIVGTKVIETRFRDTQWLNDLVTSGAYPEKVYPSIMAGFDCLWDGSCTKAKTPTSLAIRESPVNPSRTVEEALRAMIVTRA